MNLKFKPRSVISQQIEKIQSYNQLANISEIARRYFAMNAFDGVLTTIGVLIGNYLAGVRDVATPIRVGIATSIAMGISGLWGAYLTESAERQRELIELENISLIDQNDTNIGKSARFATIVVSIVDGLAPFLAALVVLIPLFLDPFIGNVILSYSLAVAMALLSLFGLGLFLGHISQGSLISYGIRTLIAGLVAIIINFLLAGE